MPPSSSSSPYTTPTTTKPRIKTPTSSSTTTTTTAHTTQLFCRHHTLSLTATGTLDLLILILVLISSTFLLTSYLSYLFTSLSLLLPSIPVSLPPFSSSAAIAAALSAFFAVSAAALCRRPRRCANPACKGLTKALEFDLQLQTEDSLSNGAAGNNDVVERLPWKGGSESNPDYECLRAELRKMAPPNGRAVLLFRAKCGCPVAKLVGWGPKKGRKGSKKALASTAYNGDHR
ncbi:uncharacterized protein At5g19025 [Silene latifolia]|uniref:uncharacterized protein At5g19025 n=1 Tax=Silene latifolia TaxID=37657 RepID=UPI003D77BFAB